MGQYYFVVSAFPPISLGSAPEMSYDEARQMLTLNLSREDFDEVVKLQSETDIRNIRALWLGQPIDLHGNYREKDLEEALLVKDNLPKFICDFLDRYESTEERLRYFSSLFASFDRDAIGLERGFLQKFHKMQREIRLCLTAVRAKVFHRDLLRELQFEDPYDPFVAELLAQNDEADVVIPNEYEDLKRAFLNNRSEPKKLYRFILQFQLTRIEEMECDRPFSMDQVLGYMARLAIVEAWSGLDEEKGHVLLEQISRL